jgi:hypothetical protein
MNEKEIETNFINLNLIIFKLNILLIFLKKLLIIINNFKIYLFIKFNYFYL